MRGMASLNVAIPGTDVQNSSASAEGKDRGHACGGVVRGSQGCRRRACTPFRRNCMLAWADTHTTQLAVYIYSVSLDPTSNRSFLNNPLSTGLSGFLDHIMSTFLYSESHISGVYHTWCMQLSLRPDPICPSLWHTRLRLLRGIPQLGWFCGR